MKKEIRLYKDGIKIRRLLYEKAAIKWYMAFYGDSLLSASKKYSTIDLGPDNYYENFSIKRIMTRTSLLCDFWREIEKQFQTTVQFKNKEEMLILIMKFFGRE